MGFEFKQVISSASALLDSSILDQGYGRAFSLVCLSHSHE